MRSLLPIIVLCFGISAYAFSIFLKEYNVARLSLQSETASFETLLYDQPSRAMTLRSDKNLFLGCDDALTGTAAYFQAKDTLQTIATQCQDIAQGALGSAPGSSLAHYTAAVASLVLGDNIEFNTHLLASQKFGQFESWIAKRRFKLALSGDAELDTSGHAAFEADINALLQSPKGQIFIAKYYARAPTIRDQVVTIAETLDANTQKAFFNVLGVAMRKAAANT